MQKAEIELRLEEKNVSLNTEVLTSSSFPQVSLLNDGDASVKVSPISLLN